MYTFFLLKKNYKVCIFCSYWNDVDQNEISLTTFIVDPLITDALESVE